jgi:hypothetical protein
MVDAFTRPGLAVADALPGIKSVDSAHKAGIEPARTAGAENPITNRMAEMLGTSAKRFRNCLVFMISSNEFASCGSIYEAVI